MFKKIVIAFDGSYGAKLALKTGIELKELFAAELETLSVIEVPEYSSTKDEVDNEIERGKTHYKEKIEEALEFAMKKGYSLTSHFIAGHPADTIISFVYEKGFDLLIMGSKGSSNVKRFLLGDVSDKVSHHAKCNVLIVKEEPGKGKAEVRKTENVKEKKGTTSKLYGKAKMLRIHIGESDKWGGEPLYQAIVEKFRENDLAGATVYKGILGYGAHRRYHQKKLFSFSQDSPITITVVDDAEKIEKILPLLDEMVKEGLVAISDVDVIAYTHKHE